MFLLLKNSFILKIFENKLTVFNKRFILFNEKRFIKLVFIFNKPNLLSSLYLNCRSTNNCFFLQNFVFLFSFVLKLLNNETF